MAKRPKPYVLAEEITDGILREFFIDTPVGRMSIKVPNFLPYQEQKRRVTLMVDTLNEFSHFDRNPANG